LEEGREGREEGGGVFGSRRTWILVSCRALPHPHSHSGIAEDLAWDLGNQAATENRTLSDFVDDIVYGAARPRCTWECTGCQKKSRTLLEHKVGGLGILWTTGCCGNLPWMMEKTFGTVSSHPDAMHVVRGAVLLVMPIPSARRASRVVGRHIPRREGILVDNAPEGAGLPRSTPLVG
jgi:hypothetical protein